MLLDIEDPCLFEAWTSCFFTENADRPHCGDKPFNAVWGKKRVAFYCNNSAKNTLNGQNAGFWNVEACGVCTNNYFAIKDEPRKCIVDSVDS